MSTEIQNLQKIAHRRTVIFLGDNLPKICGENWWKKCVIPKLNDWQEKLLLEFKRTKLEELDLATNLRIFEKNWRKLSEECSLPRELRNVIYGVMESRNHLAHEDMHGIPLNDQIRYADTWNHYIYSSCFN